MRTIIPLLVFVFLGTTKCITAQEKQAATKKTTASANTQPSPNEKFVIQGWKVAFIEEFKVKNPPRGKAKSDAVNLKEDKSFIVILDGITRTGTWSMNKAGTMITFVPDASDEVKGTFYFKIKKLDEKNFEFTYQDPQLITRYYFLAPKE